MNKSLENFFNQYQNIIETGIENAWSSRQITDAIYQKEMQNYIRKGFGPRLRELNEIKGFVEFLRKSKSTHYQWKTEPNACQRCNELNGQIFDSEPDIQSLTHPNCKCDVVEVEETEANELIKKHDEKIQERDKATSYLTENALDKADKRCATYVANALKEGGVDLRRYQDKNDPNYFKAYKYGGYLKSAGFSSVSDYEHNDKDIDPNRVVGEFPKNYEPKAGDVIIFQPSPNHDDGHSAMYNDKQWISDFAQRDAWGGSARQNAPSYTIYRNPNWIDWEIDKS